MRLNDLELVIRSNDVLEEGMEFTVKNMLLTVCSVPDFMGVGNLGVVVGIGDGGAVGFEVLKYKSMRK